MPNRKPSKTLLIINQVYVPDPAAVGQYMADVAAEMVRRGWRVVVLTADRGYDDPSARYASRETVDGVEVRRLPLSSFGKRSILLRLIGGVLFLLQSVVHGLFVGRLSRVLVSTSPPMCAAAAMAIGVVRRVPVKYWVMDLNPDQMVALGRMEPRAWPVRVFEVLNRMILKRAADVIALDRFMGERLVKKCAGVAGKLSVLPLWPLERHLAGGVRREDNPFRVQHKLQDKFVVMYSGNMSIASPLDTVLEAAVRLKDERGLMFVFIGGGLGKKRVEELLADHRLENVMVLPYEPLSRIVYSLSAADVHLVSVGDAIVGICHPSKVYSAMAVGRPILLLGPKPCHVSDMIEEHGIGWRVGHGDVEGMVTTIRQVLQTDRETLKAMGDRAKEVAERSYGRRSLCGEFCKILEQ